MGAPIRRVVTREVIIDTLGLHEMMQPAGLRKLGSLSHCSMVRTADCLRIPE